MSRFNTSIIAFALCSAWLTAAAAPWHDLGRTVTADELAAWDIDVRPDGAGLPSGSGSAEDGQAIYDVQCASCHGTFGESTQSIPIAGGIGTLASETPQRTVGSKLNYATTLWDYINRAMPFNNSKTLTADEVYAVTAYVLNLNDLLPSETVLDQSNLPDIAMPNRDGYTLAHGMATIDGVADTNNTACMSACASQAATVTSHLPSGFTAQMYGDIGTHFRRFGAPASAIQAVVDRAPPVAQEIARTNGCLACHAVDQARVGPALIDIANRYAENAEAVTLLAAKIRQGGSGVWGSVPMPPQPQIADGDLAAVVAWILESRRQP